MSIESQQQLASISEIISQEKSKIVDFGQQKQDSFNLTMSSTLRTQDTSEQYSNSQIIQFEKQYTSSTQNESTQSEINCSANDSFLTQKKGDLKYLWQKEFDLKSLTENSQIQQTDYNLNSLLNIDYHVDKMESKKDLEIEISDNTIFKKDTEEYRNQINLRQRQLSPFKYKNTLEQALSYQRYQLIKLNVIDQKYLIDIINFLAINNCIVTKYLACGAQADVLTGIYTNSEKQDIECVFKISYYDYYGDMINEEINFLKQLKNSQNMIKLLENFLIEELKIVILVIQKCKISLREEINILIKSNLNYTYNQLCFIISDLIEGVIVLRMHKIIHSDIKPDNILQTFDNTYVYSDFGVSISCQDGKVILPKGYTKKYCAPEQIQEESQISYLSDVYSLGKIIKELIQLCINQQKLSPQNQFTTEQNQKLELLLDLINEKMLKNDSKEREQCIELIFQYYEIIGKDDIPMQFYFKKKIRQFPFIQDIENKDSKFMNIILLKYQLLNLQIMIDQHGLGFKVNDIITFNQAQCQIILQSNMNVLKYLRLITTVSNLYFKVGQSSISLLFRQHSQMLLSNRQIQSQNNYMISQIAYNIGYLCLYQRQEEIAVSYFQQSLNLVKQFFKKYHPMKAQAYLQIGNCYLLLVKTDLSLKNFQKSYKIYKELYKDINHKDIALILDQLGFYYTRIGDNAKGLEYSIQSYNMRKEIHKEIHSDIAYSLSRIAYCYQNIPDNKNALIYLKQCLEIREKLFDENNITIGQTLIGLGNTLMDLNQPQEALKQYMRSIKIYNISYQNKNHLSTATALNYTSLCCQALGDFKKAKFCQNYSIWMKTQLYQNLIHPYLASSIHNKGELYLQYGNMQKGIYYCLFSYLLNKGCKDQITTVLSKSRLGKSYLECGQAQKGLKYTLQSLEFYQNTDFFQKNPLIVARIFLNIGMCQLLLREFQEALINCMKSLNILQNLLKEDQNNKVLAQCNESLGDYYLATNDNEKALDYYQQSLMIRKNLYPQNHPEIAQSYYKLGSYYDSIKDYKKSLELYLQSYHIRKDYKLVKNVYLKQIITKIIICWKIINQQIIQ